MIITNAYNKIIIIVIQSDYYCCVVVARDAAADTGQRHRRGVDGKKFPRDFHL